jgi:hypothetical protein
MKISEKIMENQGNTKINLYSAIAREYARNAYDSHIMANQSKPIEITTPTDLNSSFIVRDFGIGMSRTELVDIYSTKREVNAQIGAFGLGAKLALALVSSFTILSVKDGKKNTVTVSEDETGAGELNFLEEQDTNAENGVTITVPVPKSHLMRTAVAGLFLGWPQGMVKVDGVLIEDTVHNPEFFTAINEAGYLVVNDKGYLDKTPIKMLVGPASYEIRKERFIEIISNAGPDLWEDQGKIKVAALHNLVFRLPNGTVDLTLSRDNLVFSARTKKAIVKAYKTMELSISQNLNDKLAQVKDREEALSLYKSFIAQGFVTPITWNGEIFSS